MEVSFNNNPIPQFRLENTKRKLGVRIWGSIESFFQLHKLLLECWDTEEDKMSQAEACSYIGVISYFCYEVRHAFMGFRFVSLNDKQLDVENIDLAELFEKKMELLEVGIEFTWPHMLFIMASWWECLRHKDLPKQVVDIMRKFTEDLEQLLQQRSKTQYPKIEPYLHGAIYAANPYLMLFMEHINHQYLFWASISRMTLNTMADQMEGAIHRTYGYDGFMTELKRQAKRLDCAIEYLDTKVDDSVYEIEL